MTFTQGLTVKDCMRHINVGKFCQLHFVNVICWPEKVSFCPFCYVVPTVCLGIYDGDRNLAIKTMALISSYN